MRGTFHKKILLQYIFFALSIFNKQILFLNLTAPQNSFCKIFTFHIFYCPSRTLLWILDPSLKIPEIEDLKNNEAYLIKSTMRKKSMSISLLSLLKATGQDHGS